LRHRHSPRPTSARAPRPATDDEEERITEALAIWCNARPLRGSLAEAYLRSRGIEMPAAALDEALRFHPHCPWGIGTRPALVGLIRDVLTDEPTAVLRIALTEEGRKIAPKALGPKADGAIKLSADITTELVIGEGIESALSAMLLGYGPAWSVIDAGGIAKFPVLPEIERLIIAVDHDVSGTGQWAAAECKARWLAAGRRVRTVMSSKVGEDLNDVLQQRGRRWAGSNVYDLLRERGGDHDQRPRPGR
jgi:putative DNA primase/helicase